MFTAPKQALQLVTERAGFGSPHQEPLFVIVSFLRKKSSVKKFMVVTIQHQVILGGFLYVSFFNLASLTRKYFIYMYVYVYKKLNIIKNK